MTAELPGLPGPVADHVLALQRLRDAFEAFGAGPANKQDIAALDSAITALRAASVAYGRGEPEPARYFADGPSGHFFANDLAFASRLVGLAEDHYDEHDEWTVTDLHNPTCEPPPPEALLGKETK